MEKVKKKYCYLLLGDEAKGRWGDAELHYYIKKESKVLYM